MVLFRFYIQSDYVKVVTFRSKDKLDAFSYIKNKYGDNIDILKYEIL